MLTYVGKAEDGCYYYEQCHVVDSCGEEGISGEGKWINVTSHKRQEKQAVYIHTPYI